MKTILLIIFTLISFLTFAQNDEWFSCKCIDNSVKYSIVGPVDFKVFLRKEVNAEMEDILEVVRDIPSYKNWLYNCISIEELDYNGDADGLFHSIIEAPFPLSDIEMFIEYQIVEKENETIIIQSCIPYYKPYDERYQRVTRYKAIWKLTPLENGSVQIFYLVEMGGPKNLPKFLLELYLCDAPIYTFEEFIKVCESK